MCPFDLPINNYCIRAMTGDRKMLPCSAYTDRELHSWLVLACDNGSDFLQAIAQAALLADLKHYNLLRPVLLELKRQWPNSD